MNVVDYACVTTSVINQVCIPTMQQTLSMLLTSVANPMRTSAIDQVCITTNVPKDVHITTSAKMLVHVVTNTSSIDE
jgi:hypothetical protein